MSEEMNYYTVVDEEEIKKEKKRQEDYAKEREQNSIASPKAFAFSMKEEVARIVLLSDRPISFNKHSVKTYTKKGAEVFDILVCKKDAIGTCPICDDSEPKKPIWTGLFPILDITPYTDQKGNTYSDGKVTVLLKPFADVNAILREIKDIKEEGLDLSKCVIEVYKDGKDKNVKYSFRFKKNINLTENQVKKIDAFREKYPKAHDYCIDWLENKYEDIMDRNFRKNSNAPKVPAQTVETPSTPDFEEDVPF